MLEGSYTEEDIHILRLLKMNDQLDEELAKLIDTTWSAYQLTEKENEPSQLREILDGVHEKIISKENFFTGIGLSSEDGNPVSRHFDIMYLAKIAAIFLIFISSILFVAINIGKNPTDSVVSESIILNKSVEFGKKRTFYLSDGTKVMLNSGSELIYPGSFQNTKDRTVELKGEGFFEVARDAEKPFRVKTGSYITTALGTSFNITANNDKVDIALVTGKVKISRGEVFIKLKPGEMAECNLSNGEISKGTYDSETVLGWKEGVIKFNSAGINDVSNLLERWYGIDMEIDPGLPSNLKITGTFNNENLRSIMNGLCFSLNCRYTMDSHHVKMIKN